MRTMQIAKTMTGVLVLSLMLGAPLATQAQTVASAEEGIGKKAAFSVGQTLYVSSSRINVRSGPSVGSAVIGMLRKNDQVQVIDKLDNSTEFMNVRVVRSDYVRSDDTRRLYVGASVLSTKPIELSNDEKQARRYFIIQNIATERTRVYERCMEANCTGHKMIAEFRTVVGRPTGTKGNEDANAAKTWLGHFEITSWVKFYQDYNQHYPSWYNPSYPPLPPPGSSFLAWMSKGLLPKPDINTYRGAFGWYAAMLTPNVNEQWIHGTYGWGQDGNKFIDDTRDLLVSIVKDARSSGCTRLSNESISFVRHITRHGADMIRIYANEAWRDRKLTKYPADVANPGRWNYALTTESVNKPGMTIDRDAVTARGIPQSEIIEEGYLLYDRKPSARAYRKVISDWVRRWNPTGNIYNIDSSDFKGVFLVDEGVLYGYQHPANKLKVGGYPTGIPPFVQTNDGRFEKPSRWDMDTEEGE